MDHYITNGSIPADAPEFYVQRLCDRQMDEYLRRSDYITVLGPKLCGKTSLLVRKYHELQKLQRYLPVFINLSLMSSLAEDAWHQRLHSEIVKGLQDENQHTIRPTDALSLRDALLDLLERRITTRVLVIMLDEVETIPPAILTPLMAMIREIFSSRQITEAFKRCVFVLAGSFLPDNLIKDPSISPFNVAEQIYMTDATLEGVEQLTNLMNAPELTLPKGIAQRIYDWTEGDLYLTQRLCSYLQHHSPLSVELVDKLATTELIEDKLFYNTQRHLNRNPSLLSLLKKIQAEPVRPIRFTRLPDPSHIADGWLMGILKPDAQGNCAIRNAIYEMVLKRIMNGDDTDSAPERTKLLKDRYLLDPEPFKSGGMGEIFRATDKTTGEVVAVKRLLGRFASHPVLYERFQREAEALRRLNDPDRHRNIVHFIDVFAEEGYPYIIMEYVQGGSLAELLHDHRNGLPIKKAIQILAGVSDGLAHAHHHNILHRDIKPSNMLLTLDHIPQLADFGLARPLEEERLTRFGELMGTYGYMSPEVLDGKDATPQSDLWSVGAVLFEMLTGTLPFKETDRQSMANIQRLRDDVPDELAEIAMLLLAHDPDRRFASADQLSLELHALLASLPMEA